MDETVIEARGVATDMKGILEENRDQVATIVDNIETGSGDAQEFLAELNGELTDKFNELLDSGQQGLDKANEVLAKANATVDEELPNVRRSLANFRLASDQLSATTSEVRRAPWRLLYRPDTRELDFELLYDAARSYAGAVSDLRSASESMQSSISAMESSGEVDRERLDRLVESLDAAFGRYKVTEQQFLDLVGQHAGGS
jgi:chaperonin cofactor prefoldin